MNSPKLPRDEALQQGTLIDISEVADAARFQLPVALTREAWDESVAWQTDRAKPDESQQAERIKAIVFSAQEAVEAGGAAHDVTTLGTKVLNFVVKVSTRSGLLRKQSREVPMKLLLVRDPGKGFALTIDLDR